MTKQERFAIQQVASYVRKEYLRLHNPNDSWDNRTTLQAYYDTLCALKYNKLIEDFDLEKGVLMQGKWYP